MQTTKIIIFIALSSLLLLSAANVHGQGVHGYTCSDLYENSYILFLMFVLFFYMPELPEQS